MKASDAYSKFVEWSDEDGCYVGRCPDLFYGGCHGSDEIKVFIELCAIVEEVVADHIESGRELPPASKLRDHSKVA